MYLLQTLQIALASHDAWQVFAVGWGNADALDSPQWLWFDVPVLSGISTCHAADVNEQCLTICR